MHIKEIKRNDLAFELTAVSLPTSAIPEFYQRTSLYCPTMLFIADLPTYKTKVNIFRIFIGRKKGRLVSNKRNMSCS